MNTKPVSITHLVFGLIFLGATALWVVGAATDLEAPALAVWGPVVLIASGLVGLAATVLNARNERTERTESGLTPEPDAPQSEHADTVSVDHEEQS